MKCIESGDLEHIHPSNTHTHIGVISTFTVWRQKNNVFLLVGSFNGGSNTPILLDCFMGIEAPSDF